jgi:integrase
MREIQVTWNRQKERWQVLVPAELSGTGRRKRRFFADEAKAKALVAQINGDRRSIAELFHRLSPDAQGTILRCLHRVDGDAGQIEQALDAWLKRKEADETLTLAKLRDECIASKQASGRRESYIANLQNSLRQFTTGREKDLAARVTPAEIDAWLNGNGWAAATRQGMLKDLRTLFSFGVRRGYLADNPAEKVDRPLSEDKSPGILTVEQVRLLMSRAAANDRPLARFLAVQLFGGLRREEAERLTEAEILKDSILVSARNKTRKKRFVEINETLRAWLALPGELPLKNLVRRVRRVRGEIRRVQSKRGVREKHVIDIPWPKNALRHSFCSYALPVLGAKQTANQAGHSEDVLYSHYRELVTRDAALAFWSIVP